MAKGVAKGQAGSGAAVVRRKKVETSRSTVILHALHGLYVAICSISIHSYFLWSALVLASCGILFAVSEPNIQTFLCDMSPQASEGGQGCENCNDDLLLCAKDVCFRTAVNITWHKYAMYSNQALYQQFMQASRDNECNELIRNFADDPVQMVEQISDNIDKLTTGCVKFHCQVLNQAMGGDSDLDASVGTCTNAWRAKHSVPASECVCAGLVTSDATLELQPTIDQICGPHILSSKCPWGDVTPGWCATTTTATTTVTIGAASSRRLAGVEPEQQAGALAWAPSSAPAAKQSEEFWQAPSRLQLEGWGLGRVPAKRGCGEGWANTSAPLRALQSPTPSAAVELNNVLQDWDVGAWSPCSCYQQCTPGIRTRLVTCGTTQCAEPVPAREEHCQCFHCADCPVIMWLLVQMIVSFSASGVAGLLFLCFLYSTNVKEEQLIKIPFSKKLIGMNCKLVPPLVRLAVLSTVVFSVLLLAMTFAHRFFGIEWSTQCYSSPVLRVVSVVQAGLVCFQMFLGRCAKRLCRRPAWLFSPARSSYPFPLKQFSRLLRALSP